mmetsp:Transcript_31003/g.46775  ORF Transcript_31003/g.46775 Transcript_31003/m.46775 type:complete len:85 (-) Transcript_31003:297-551(-)
MGGEEEEEEKNWEFARGSRLRTTMAAMHGAGREKRCVRSFFGGRVNDGNLPAIHRTLAPSHISTLHVRGSPNAWRDRLLRHREA